MKSLKRFNLVLVVVLVLAISVSLESLGSEVAKPTAELPVVTTTAGQGSDVLTFNILGEEVGLTCDFCDVLSTEMIDAGVGLGGAEPGPDTAYNYAEVKTNLEEFPLGTPYETIVIVIGASLKGMGASGLTISSEEARVKDIIKYCKEKKVFIIGVHTGGESRRGAPKSDQEKMIDAVAPFADYLIVLAEGNKDGRFTTIAEDKSIPLTEIEYHLDLLDLLKQVFQLGE